VGGEGGGGGGINCSVRSGPAVSGLTWGAGLDDLVQSAQKLLPLQQVLPPLYGGVDLAVVASELWQVDGRAAVLRGGAQETTGQV